MQIIPWIHTDEGQKIYAVRIHSSLGTLVFMYGGSSWWSISRHGRAFGVSAWKFLITGALRNPFAV
jgi:hypothetical protein